MAEYFRSKIEGTYIIKPVTHRDERGWFAERLNTEELYHETGFRMNVTQVNTSSSKQGVIRGLHIQGGGYEQTKIVSVERGEALVVLADLRLTSSTYLVACSFVLNSRSVNSVVVPKGLAHGFQTLSETPMKYTYYLDGPRMKNFERGVNPSSPELKGFWQGNEDERIIKSADLQWPMLADYHDFYSK
jgi:dTDP-4-dehydrorhamnose 3,5-epimerase